MVQLYCAIVNVAAGPFPVEIDENEIAENLKKEKLGQVHTEDQNGHVHVLVELVQHPPRLAGPDVNVTSADDLLAFLEREMKDCDAISSSARLLGDESLRFSLTGRKEAVEAASSRYRNIINSAENHTSGAIEIPVCSGISGMGKTRMLEESRTIQRSDPSPVSLFRTAALLDPNQWRRRCRSKLRSRGSCCIDFSRK